MSELSDKHPIEVFMSSAMQGLKEMIDVNTIVGSPITTSDGTVIMPISKVALGFGVGGSEFPKNKKLLSGEQEEVNNLFGGGTGGGLSLTPVGFLVVGNGTIRMVPVSEENSIYDRIIDAVPTAIDKVSEIISSAKGKSNVVVDHEPAAPDSYVPDDESDDYVAGSFEG